MAVDVKVLVTLGDEVFEMGRLSVQEMAKVKLWTTFKNRAEWFSAIRDEDPQALLAAYALVKQRKGESVRMESIDFDLDTLTAQFVDSTGREIEPVLDKNKDGTPKTDKDGSPIPLLDASGQAQWTYADTGNPVPPTAAASTT